MGRVCMDRVCCYGPSCPVTYWGCFNGLGTELTFHGLPPLKKMDDSSQRKDGLPKLREILRRQRDETDVSVGLNPFTLFFFEYFLK